MQVTTKVRNGFIMTRRPDRHYSIEVLPRVTFPASGIRSWLLFVILAVVAWYSYNARRLDRIAVDFDFISFCGNRGDGQS